MLEFSRLFNQGTLCFLEPKPPPSIFSTFPSHSPQSSNLISSLIPSPCPHSFKSLSSNPSSSVTNLNNSLFLLLSHPAQSPLMPKRVFLPLIKKNIFSFKYFPRSLIPHLLTKNLYSHPKIFTLKIKLLYSCYRPLIIYLSTFLQLPPLQCKNLNTSLPA